MNELHELDQLLHPHWRPFDTKRPPETVILAPGYKVILFFNMYEILKKEEISFLLFFRSVYSIESFKWSYEFKFFFTLNFPPKDVSRQFEFPLVGNH